VFSALPSKIKTLEPLEPPAQGVVRTEAVKRLRGAQQTLVGAINGLDAKRASGHVMQFPFGAINLYQVAEFLVAHTDRHIAQIQRCAG
jgi:hypothetical protein